MRTTTLIVASAVSLVSVAGAALGQSATALWASNCASCHAADGSGGGAGTQTLLKPDFAIKALDRQYFDAIKNGVKDEEGGSAGMVAFGETLSDEQIWSLVVHIRELQAAAVRKKGPQVRPNGGVYASTHESYRVEKVAEASLEVPWSVDFLPTGEMIVANRGGELLVFGPDAPDAPMKVQGVPAVAASGPGGLMDVAPLPDFATNRRLLISYSHPLRRQAQQGGRSGGGASSRRVSLTVQGPASGAGAWLLSGGKVRG
ncbi:MAG: PQQ-dependent sugar dehydrogenase, partial [Phycisphaerales bacterium]